jgi:hypothetical protein
MKGVESSSSSSSRDTKSSPYEIEEDEESEL